jgi:hypothetical protein
MYVYAPAQIDRLADPQVWLDAGAQVLYSFSLAVGGLIAFASYNPIKNNCKRDTIAVSITNVLTALYAAMTVFAVLGYMANSVVDKCEAHNTALLNAHFANLSADEFSAWNMRVTLYRVYVELEASNFTLQNAVATDPKWKEVPFSLTYFYEHAAMLSDQLRCSVFSMPALQGSASSWLSSDVIARLSLMPTCVFQTNSTWQNESVLRALVTGFHVCDLTRELDNSGEGTGLAFVTFAQAITG